MAHTLVHDDFANPTVVFDEIDKAGGDARHGPLGTLYGLLEHDTAKVFKDERAIPEPVLNRMNIYEVPRPDRYAALAIAAAPWREIIGEHDWGFPPQSRRRGAGTARRAAAARDAEAPAGKLAGRNAIGTRDFDTARMGRSRKIGF